MKLPKQYKWVPVFRLKQGKTPNANASYSPIRKRIYIYDNFFTHPEENQKAILEHEYAHHIYYKMPIVYRKIWTLISNGKLIKLLNIMGIIDFKENGFVTSYAKKNEKEDFAECIEANYLKQRFKLYTQFKFKIAVSMFNYFSNK